MSDDDDRADRSSAFGQRIDAHRPALVRHCYRMTGSARDAEDLVQETFLRAWRSRRELREAGSLRAWLYRIATRACLDRMRSARRTRELLFDPSIPPSGTGLGLPLSDDHVWVEPLPDTLSGLRSRDGSDPSAELGRVEHVRLAFVEAVQTLSPRRRAILLLHDVLGWSAAETAAALDTSVAAVNSALQRARASLAARARPPDPFAAAAAPGAEEAGLVSRYVDAWEARDPHRLAALLTDDAFLRMPPYREWYRGRDAVAAFFARVWRHYGGFRARSTRANGGPAVLVHATGGQGTAERAHSVHLLALEDGALGGIVAYVGPLGPALVPLFDTATVPALALSQTVLAPPVAGTSGSTTTSSVASADA